VSMLSCRVATLSVAATVFTWQAAEFVMHPNIYVLSSNREGNGQKSC